MGGNTHNIVLSSIYNQFHVGFGANTASYKKCFKFDTKMNKTQQLKLFKNILAYLVSETYSKHYKFNKNHEVWNGYEKLK